jgi:hypothetical protein
MSIGNPTSFFRPVLDLGQQGARPFDIRHHGWFIGVVDVNASGTTQPVLSRAPEMRVITNWFEELKQRVPVK